MTAYFRVESNLKHNGTLYEKGSVMEGQESVLFDTLVEQGTLSRMEAPHEDVKQDEEKPTQTETKETEESKPESPQAAPLKAYEVLAAKDENLGDNL